MTSAVEDPDGPTETEPAGTPMSGSLAGDILSLYVRPSVLFAELPRCNRAMGAFLILLACILLYGYAVISTGVLDYEIDRQTQKEISQIRQHSETEEGNEKMANLVDSAEKGGIFRQKMARVSLMVGGPLYLLISLSLLSGVLFMAIALRGGKPNYQLLFGISVFAALVEIPSMMVRVLLISQLHISRVETSAAAFINDPAAGLGAYLVLRRLDPFAVWFYVLVGMGLYYSGQMSRRGALIATCLVAVLAALIHGATDIPELAVITISMGKS
ncbi:MAG: YIP1 family protein [Gemmataceae bacterium]